VCSSDLYFPAIIQWVGFKQVELDVQHGERHSGRSSYDLAKLVNLGISVVISFSDKPLKLVMLSGFCIAMLSILASLVTLIAFLSGSISVEGWTSIVLSLWFLAGCILLSLGLVGLYVGRILTEAKGRPTFIVAETIKAPETAQGSRASK